MSYILFDDREIRNSLLPLSFTRPVAAFRVGIFTIAEKWEHHIKDPIFFKTEAYLLHKFPTASEAPNHLYINGALLPNNDIVTAVGSLKIGQTLRHGNLLLAYSGYPGNDIIKYSGPLKIIQNLWDILTYVSEEIEADLSLIRNLRQSQTITDPHTKTYNPENIFIEEGVTIRAAIINAEAGPVYLGKNAVVNEGVMIKGPFALGEGSQITMGAKMRGDSSVGPFCKVGGEVSNSVVFAYSNKGHDGFIGNTIIGEWCNLGADTNTSNLKNNYGEVELYSYKQDALVKTGRQFMGLVMGDHSKCGINTMFNTGTVVGVSANIFGGGFPPKFIPSFSWGGAQGFSIFDLEKSFKVAEAMMMRRHLEFNDTEKSIFRKLFADRNLTLKTLV